MTQQEINPGDRVEYISQNIPMPYGLATIGPGQTTVVIGHGTVIDIIEGVAGKARHIVSKPDGTVADFRLDVQVDGVTYQTVRAAS